MTFRFLFDLYHKFIKFNSIRNRIFVYFVLLVILPVSAISVTLLQKSTNVITHKFRTSIYNSLNVVDQNISQKLESANNNMNALCLNPELIDILSKDNILNNEFKRDDSQIVNEMEKISKILDNSNNAFSPSIIPRLYIYNRPEYNLNRFTNRVFDMEDLIKETWYPLLKAHKPYVVCGMTKSITPEGVFHSILMAKRLYGLKNRDFLFAGVLTLEVPIKDFSNLLYNFKPSPNSSALVVGSDGIIYLSSNQDQIGKRISSENYLKITNGEYKDLSYGSFTSTINSVETLITYKRIEPYNWTIISFSPLKDLNGELNSYKKLVYIEIAICILIALMSAFLVSDSIAYPVKKLIKSMTAIRGGNFDVKLDYKRDDEFSVLITAFKIMVDEINDLIHRLYVTEINKKEAELQALQAQINPHFLYNTLDSVNWMAMRHKVPDISVMVKALSNFFRYSLNKGETIITLKDEFSQVENYLVIQKIRFKEKINYKLDFSVDILEYITVKLILQPIVENSIIHGIQNLPGTGDIHIKAKKNGENIEIAISDNGLGADVEYLNSTLNDSTTPSKSYGTRNVNKRIKQFFGEQYGLTYISNESAGITAIVKIPAIRTVEDLNAKNDNS